MNITEDIFAQVNKKVQRPLVIWLIKALRQLIFFLFLDTELAPIITGIVSTTSTFTVFWNHPTSYYNLISEYEVKWKVSGTLQEASHSVNKTLKQHTVSSGLVSGQLYTVYVISHVNFLNPQGSISVNSNDTTIRLGMKFTSFELVYVFGALISTIDLQRRRVLCKDVG